MTEIKRSLIKNAGNGLFATKRYKKGDYICYYDGEYKPIETFEDFEYSIDNPFTQTKLIGHITQINRDGVGQFINDYCRLDLTDDDRNEHGFYMLNSEQISQKIQNYCEKSKLNENVCFKKGKSNLFKMFALKNIEIGDELYYSYGINYWISHIRYTTDEPFTRVWCLMKLNLLTRDNNTIYFDKEPVKPEDVLSIIGISPNGRIIEALEFMKHPNFEKVIKIMELIK